MKLARRRRARPGRAEAWTHVQLGKLYCDDGRIARAEREDRTALRGLPRLRATRSTRSPGSQAAPGTCRAAIAAEHAAVDRDPAAAVRRDARRPLPRRPASRGSAQQAVRADRRRSSGCSSRTASRPTSRPRSSTSTTGSACRHALALARPAQRERPVDRRRRRARLGARPQRPLRRGAAATRKRALRLGTQRRAQVLPPRDDRALPRPRAPRRARWFGRALALNPHFSLLWAPVARRALR